MNGCVVLFTQELADLRLDGLLTLIVMTYGRLGDLFVLLKYPEQLQGPKKEFDAQMETASYRKLKARRTLLLQYLLQQYRSLTGEDKPVSDGKEMEKCGAMPLLTESTLMMRIGPLVLIFGLRDFVTVVYGPVVTHVFPDVQVEAYRHSVLYVNLVSVLGCSVLNWVVEQRELRRMASEDRIFGRIAEPGLVLMDLNNSFKCRMGSFRTSNSTISSGIYEQSPRVRKT